MKKKIIAIGIIGMFLASAISAVTVSASKKMIEDENIQSCGGDILYLRTGEFYSEGGVTWVRDPDFRGTKVIPHDHDVTLFCDWEVVDTLVPAEYWFFEFSVRTYGHVNGIFDQTKWFPIYDEIGVDDSQAGQIKITIPLEKFINGADSIRFEAGGCYEIPWLNISESVYDSYIVPIDLVNDPPRRPGTPDGPKKIKYPSTQTYTTEVIDPDGDPMAKYEWRLDRKRDDYYQKKTTTEPYVKINFPCDMSWGKEEYSLKVRAQDTYLTWSEWSDPLEITARRLSRDTHSFYSFLEGFVDRFPLLERILNLQ